MSNRKKLHGFLIQRDGSYVAEMTRGLDKADAESKIINVYGTSVSVESYLGSGSRPRLSRRAERRISELSGANA